MHINEKTQHIDLNNLILVSRGDSEKMEKYLRQFQALTPERSQNLRKNLESRNRKMVRQTLHQMSPQLQFFGIPDVLDPIRRLEQEYQTIPFEELEDMVYDIELKINAAKQEVDGILEKYFE